VLRRDVNLSPDAVRGLYSFQRGDPTLEAINNTLEEIKKGNMPQDANPVAGIAGGYEVYVLGARILYRDIPGGPVRVLNIE